MPLAIVRRVLVASCALNLTLGALTLLRPSVLLYAVQSAAIVGYTLTAAFHVPELTLDHCGPLVRNFRCAAASSCCGWPRQGA